MFARDRVQFMHTQRQKERDRKTSERERGRERACAKVILEEFVVATFIFNHYNHKNILQQTQTLALV